VDNTLWRRLPHQARFGAVLGAGAWGALLILGGFSWGDPWTVLAGALLLGCTVFALVRTHAMRTSWGEPAWSLAAISGAETAGLTLGLGLAVVLAVAAIALMLIVGLAAVFFSAADS